MPDPLPTIELRFPARYAWGVMVGGVIFFFLGFLVGGKSPGLGAFISFISLGAVIGANYWRHHLHVVARLTPRQLILRRGGTVEWTNIAAIDKNVISVPRGQTEFVCIKLIKKPPRAPGLQGFMEKMKTSVLGYDIIVPDGDLACTADWFMAECTKRWAAARETKTAGESSVKP